MEQLLTKLRYNYKSRAATFLPQGEDEMRKKTISSITPLPNRFYIL